MTAIVAYLLLFIVVGSGFVFIHLMIGKLIRPIKPDPEKQTIYECGEPTIGSSWIQFDLRFYVVALLFVIFDVEVAFFFPWAVVFGKANTLAMANVPAAERQAVTESFVPANPENEAARAQFSRLMATGATEPMNRQYLQAVEKNRQVASGMAMLSFGDILIFFGVLLVGYAYLWKRGDLDWVRSVAAEVAAAPRSVRPVLASEPQVLVGASPHG